MSAATFPHLARAIEHSRGASERTKQMVAEAVSRYIWLMTLARL